MMDMFLKNAKMLVSNGVSVNSVICSTSEFLRREGFDDASIALIEVCLKLEIDKRFRSDYVDYVISKSK